MYLMDRLWVSVVILNMSCINGIAIREERFILHLSYFIYNWKQLSIFRTLTYFRNKNHLIPYPSQQKAISSVVGNWMFKSNDEVSFSKLKRSEGHLVSDRDGETIFWLCFPRFSCKTLKISLHRYFVTFL